MAITYVSSLASQPLMFVINFSQYLKTVSLIKMVKFHNEVEYPVLTSKELGVCTLFNVNETFIYKL